MPKLILYGKDARAALVRGADALANAVKVTLGPAGRLVVMSRRGIGQSPQVTKDGVTVANHCDPRDATEQLGSDLIREAAQKTVQDAGDGTTTSVVLAQAIIHAGMKQLEAGVSPASLEQGIKRAVKAITEQLDKMALPADGERLAQVATIAANGDAEIGALIHEAIKKVGKDGVMTCEESRSLDTVLEVVDGLQLKQGFRSPHFINDPERQECAFDNPLIFLHEGRLGAAKSLVNIIKMAAEAHRPLLVVSGDYEPEALSILVVNKIQAGIPLCAIRADAWGDRRREILRDIAVLTGGKALTEDLGLKLENVTREFFGEAKRIVVTEYRTTIIEGAGEPSAIQVRADEIRELIKKAEQPESIVLLQQRLSGLTGGVAILRVGGATESEMRERKDRVEDAMYATKAAAEEGIVMGGGLALAQCIVVPEINGHWFLGVLHSPYRQILENAGIVKPSKLQWWNPWAWWVDRRSNMTLGRLISGYNLKTGSYGDMVELGIIDPVKVVKAALINAASVACTILKTETLIADIPEQK